LNYKFGVYGDSIAFGYGNNNQSWFDIVSLGSKAIKLAQNGETICDVLKKIKLDNNCYEVLYVAVGVNDLLVSFLESGKIDFSFLMRKYEEVLKIALIKSKKVIVQSLLPVREELFPNQDWLDDDKWCYNLDIKEFNRRLCLLCDKLKVQYKDVYSKFCTKNLESIYIDAVHLNKIGQEELSLFMKL